MHVESERGRAAVTTDLGRHQRIGLEVRAMSAMFLRHANGEQARLVQVPVVRHREDRVAVPLFGAAGEAVLAETPGLGAERRLFAGEAVTVRIEHRRIAPLIPGSHPSRPPFAPARSCIPVDQLAVLDHIHSVEADSAVPHRQVEMPQSVAVGEFVGAGRVKEVASKGADLGAVEIALVVHGERLVASRLVQPPSYMRSGISVAVAPGSPVAPEELGVGALALDGGDVVVFDGEPHRRLKVTLEGQVDIAGIEHQPALDRACSGERDDNSARPVGDRSGPVAIAPHARARRPLQRDGEVGAGVGGDPHLLRRP